MLALPPAEGREHRFPAIERWLARADLVRAPGVGEEWLLAQWGLDLAAPLAALTLLGETGKAPGGWLRADPVHQQVVRHATLLHGDSVLRLSRDEADTAIAALNRFFASDGLVFQAPEPGRWYIALGDRAPPITTPIERLSGTNPFGHLPEGNDRAFWRRVFSEAQMLLADLPFNAQREAAGRPTLNGIWLWGGGALPASLLRPFARVYANTPLARGLALLSDTKTEPLPVALDAVAPSPGEALVALDALPAPTHTRDSEDWLQAARELESRWCRIAA